MSYHILGFLLGILLDLIIGDPYQMPHPIRAIGSMIAWLDHRLMDRKMQYGRNAKKEFWAGVLLCICVLTVTFGAIKLIMTAAGFVHPVCKAAAEAILTCYVLAARSLQTESMKVYGKLKTGTLPEARKAVSMIVGRDTECLDRIGVIKAAVETVAENTSDGVIAPLLYTFLGGPVLGMLYKAVNTMDSMVGYHNDRYEHFGTAAARLDDIVNYIPARLSAWFLIGAACLCGDTSGKDAVRIFRRDRYRHKSPNSAQTESVCAGALGIRLVGNAVYFGKTVEKPYIGDDLRTPEEEDIPRTCRLMFLAEAIGTAACLLLYILVK